MDKTYSIAEARNDLSGVVREAEAGRPVTLSRRGRPVAVIVSASEFARLAPRRRALAVAIDDFRREFAAHANACFGQHTDERKAGPRSEQRLITA